MSSNPKNGDYVELLNPRGYVNNREITNLDGQFLVKGSKNCLIRNNEKVVTRPGSSLIGGSKTLNKKVHSSFDWETNDKKERSIRAYDDELEFYYNSQWVRIKDGWLDTDFAFTTWWDSTELIDVLIFVNGTDKLHEWSGAITEVASVTANTITKKGYLDKDTFEFNDNGSGTRDTITDTESGFVDAGFEAGDIISVSGTSNNDGDYTIHSVTANTITLELAEELSKETTTSSVVIKWRDTGTWGQSRFFTADTRAVVINGVEYTYTGGETTGTLTGVSGSPLSDGVTSGDYAIQAIREYEPAQLDEYDLNIIATLNNHIWVGSDESRTAFMSSNTDFSDFTSSPTRAPGEGDQFVFDATPTAFIPDEQDMKVTAGRDEIYKISYEFTADKQGEVSVIQKLKTSRGQAARSQGAVIPVKNNILYVSFESTIDSLGTVENIEGLTGVPISDPIKNDIESYDLTGVHGLYWRNDVYIALPEENLVLVYDLLRGYWQPPQTYPISRLAIIDDHVAGHANYGNETFKLFDENVYNDNGQAYETVVAFGYENYGSRFTKKTFDELATELYMTRNTTVEMEIYYEYLGAEGIKSFQIEEGDNSTVVYVPSEDASFGKNPFGSNPFGSSVDDLPQIVKARSIHGTERQDFIERQRIYRTSNVDDYFEIIASGENVEFSTTLPTIF